MRIQTTGILAVDVLRKGLSDLSDLCDHVRERFEVFSTAFPPPYLLQPVTENKLPNIINSGL